MILPFQDVEGRGLLTVVCPVIEYHVNRLSNIYKTKRGRGDFDDAWRCYQSELALEELLYGRPLSPADSQLSQILGTSASRSKSVTKIRGFPGLSPHNSAKSEVSPPPLEKWTKDKWTADQIKRIFSLVDILMAAPSTVGVQLWKILLSDLNREPDSGLCMADLKSENHPAFTKVVCASNPDNLIELIESKKAFPFPMVFDKAKELVRKSGGNVVECLTLGLQELQLRWFPHIRLWQTKNPRASWNRKSVVEFFQKDKSIHVETRIAVMLGQVLQEMERRGLVYHSKLERYREQGMPWLHICMLRVSKAVQPTKEVVDVLTFLSCIALLENNDFVDFKALEGLLRDMPFPMSRMQELLLLSKYILPKGTPFKLWKLHETIPTRLPPRQAGAAAQQQPPKRARVEENEEQQQEDDVQEVEEEEEPGRVRKHLVRFLPPNTKTRWSSEELALLHLEPGLTHKEAYKLYLKDVEQKTLPARTFTSFHRKRQRYI